MASYELPFPAASVVLAGAGPGDPGLLTLAAASALAQADAVLHDALLDEAVLGHAPASAERVFVGKRAGFQAASQEEINALLIDRARAGQRVVRLKGGDPFVFGRGGEEAIACAEAGVPCRVVPGVTSAIAGPASIGVPVTHRGVSTGFLVVHGQSPLDWDAVRRAADTVVVLMGFGRLAEHCAEALAAGIDPRTPAAAIEWATTARQRHAAGTLADLPAAAVAAGLATPAVLVIGPAVGLAGRIAAP